VSTRIGRLRTTYLFTHFWPRWGLLHLFWLVGECLFTTNETEDADV
jgi:hypothetical protein